MQSTFTGGLMGLVDVLEQIVPGEAPEDRRRKAFASLSAMVGAVILARAMDDPALSQEFLSATRQELTPPPGKDEG